MQTNVWVTPFASRFHQASSVFDPLLGSPASVSGDNPATIIALSSSAAQHVSSDFAELRMGLSQGLD